MSDQIDNLLAALRLEIAAVARYQEHQEKTNDPAIHSFLQGLMRNEDGHEEELRKNITRLGGSPDDAMKLPPPALPSYVWDGTEVRGQKTNMAILRADLAFEHEAVRTYHIFAAQTDDEESRKLLIELTRAEHGHVKGLKNFIGEFEEGTRPVVFFCPVCGWEVSFEINPEPGAESRCKMCGVTWVLGEEDRDFLISRK